MFISVVFTQLLPRNPNHFPLPRHWTGDRDFGPATATLDPPPRLWTRDRDFGPATRDPRLLVRLESNVELKNNVSLRDRRNKGEEGRRARKGKGRRREGGRGVPFLLSPISSPFFPLSPFPCFDICHTD